MNGQGVYCNCDGEVTRGIFEDDNLVEAADNY
jgi:hypothetical protein